MALKADAKTKIKALGFDVDKLIAAVTAEAETDFEVPDVVAFKQEDLDTRDANKVAEGKTAGMKEGEKQGKELAAKALKKKFGIEDDSKELDKVVDLVNTKVATGDTGLREQNAALLKDKERLEADLQQEKSKTQAVLFDNQLITDFPPGRSESMTDAERLMIIKANLQFEETDGKVIVKRNGEVLKNKDTHAPIPVKQAISEYFTERSWLGKAPVGGRGGGDNLPDGTAGLKTRTQVQEQWLKENPQGNPVSPEFQAYLDKAAKDVPDFDYYN